MVRVLFPGFLAAMLLGGCIGMPCDAICIDSVEARATSATSAADKPDFDVTACHNDHCQTKRVTLDGNGTTICNGVWGDGCGLYRDDASQRWVVSMRWDERAADGDSMRMKIVEHQGGKVVLDASHLVAGVKQESACGSSCRSASVDFDAK